MGDMADLATENGELDLLENGIRCKFCDENELEWENQGTKKDPIWKLVEYDGTVHNCNK